MKNTKHLFNKIISLQISFCLIFLPSQAAVVKIDGTTNTNINTTASGVPIINISNPNSSGLSHNKFTDYNVDSKGLILNNSKQLGTNTQLAGYVFGNSNLTTNAKVILNEVTSTKRSSINGYTEIAGKRADLIMANPNGLSINGAGFINTGAVTFTTGTPIILNGKLNSLNVNGGDILIHGTGLDSSQVDSTYIYTHYLKLNGQINAKKLDIVLGKNNIDYDSKKILSSKNSGETTNLLLDASSLGGMYANRISLVGTDKGLGVNLPPEVLASSGNISISNDGKISLQKLSATNDISITSKSDDISVNDVIYSSSDIGLESSNTITSNGDIKAKNTVTIKSDTLDNKSQILSGLNEDNTLNANGQIDITSNTLLNNSGTIQSTNTIDTNTNTVNNNGKIVSQNSLKIDSENSLTNEGTISSNSLNLKTKALTNTKDILVTTDSTITSSSLTNTGSISANTLNINNQTDITTTNGEISADKLIINTDTLDSTNTQILSSDTITLNATTSLNNAGNIQANNTLNLKSKDLVNSGIILSNNDISIDSDEISTTDGLIKALNIDIDSINFTNNNTTVQALDTLDLNSVNTINNSGILQALKTQKLKTTTLTNTETLLSNDLDIYTTTLINKKDILATNTLNLTSNTTDNQSNILAQDNITINSNKSLKNTGSISSNKKIDITTDTLNNAGIVNANSLNLTTKTLTNTNEISSFTTLDFINTDTLNNSGSIKSDGTVNLNTDYLNNTNGSIEAKSLDLDTNTINLNNSNLYASNDLILNLDALNNTSTSTIGSGKNLTINASSYITNNTNLLSNGILTLNTNGNFINNSIISGDSLNLTSNSLTNNSTISGGTGSSSIVVVNDIDNNSRISAIGNLNVSGKNITNDGYFNSGNNLTINSTNLTNNRTLFASNDMNLYTKNTLQNNENGNIYAINNLTLAANDVNDKTTTINNNKANIETYQGDINIYANNFNNYTDGSISVQGVVQEVEGVMGLSANYINGELDFSQLDNFSEEELGLSNVILEIIGGEIVSEKETEYKELDLNSVDDDYVRDITVIDHLVITQQKLIGEVDNTATLFSGKNLNIYADNMTNRYSNITSSNDLYMEGDIFNNEASSVLRLHTQTKIGGILSGFITQSREYLPGASSTIQAGGEANINVTTVTNENFKTNQDISNRSKNIEDTSISTNNNNPNGVSIDKVSLDVISDPHIDSKDLLLNILNTNPEDLKSIIPFISIDIPTDDYGLFVKSKNPNSQYLIESNPEFTMYNNFISSNYFIDQLNFDPEITTKRVGDDFYENKLIRESIEAQTGKTFLNQDITNDYDQYKYLMDNALNAKDSLNLTAGISLSAAQVNALTQDIVWMEEKIIDNQKVLVPVVYVVSPENLEVTGAKIIAKNDVSITSENFANNGTVESENNVSITATNDILNSGNLSADNDIVLSAGNQINNIFGDITASNDISLSAVNDITNLAGDIKATAISLQSTNGSIVNKAFEREWNSKKSKINHIGKQANIEASGTLSMDAAKSIDIKASNVKAGDLSIKADEINIVSADASFTAKNYRSYNTNIFSNIEANNISLNSKSDTNIKGANVVATEDMIIQAKNLNVEAVQDKDSHKYRMGSSKYTVKTTTNQSSNLDANNLLIIADNDVNIIGSNVTAQDTANVLAKNINLISVQDESYEKKSKKTSHTFGSSTSTKITSSTTNVESLLSADKVNINTQSLTLLASKIRANEAQITADIINLISGKDTEYKNKFTDSSGFITRTIETKGSVTEFLREAKIEVSDKLIINGEDFTEQLSTDNILKTLSSEGTLSNEQINLVKATLNNDEWHTKTTTLSGVGSLVIAAVIAVVTAGAGAALVGAAGTAAAGTTAAAVQSAVVQSIVSGVTTQLTTSAITGNSFKLDGESLLKGAVSAGVMSYANTALSINALNESMSVTDYAQNAVVRGTAQGIASEVTGGDFKDGFKTGAVVSVFNDGALQMRKYVKDNFDYAGKNGEAVPDNVKSVGVNGDGVKLGGSGLDPKTGEKIIAPLGGAQTGERLIFGMPYDEGGIVDNTIEYFAGPHDFMSSWNYENIDGKTFLQSDGAFVNATSGLLLIPSIPLAAAPFIQNNINEINAINNVQKQEENKIDNIIKE